MKKQLLLIIILLILLAGGVVYLYRSEQLFTAERENNTEKVTEETEEKLPTAQELEEGFKKSEEKESAIANDEKSEKFVWDGESYSRQLLEGHSSGAEAQNEAKIVVDLDGDGEVESFYKQRDRVFLIREDETVWATPEDWKVNTIEWVDFNNDEESELLVSVKRKREETDENENYVFVYIWEGNKMKEMWASGRLENPVLEMASGDFDEDGKNEIVVAETTYELWEDEESQKKFISVWQWSGSEFVSEWRSEEVGFGKLEEIFVL